MSGWDDAVRAEAGLAHEIADLLYCEAALLDERRFGEWLGWMADDLRYVMPIRSNRLPRDRERDIGATTDVAHFDEDKASFAMRIRRLGNANAWAEDPPSRIRRFVSNVRVRCGTGDDAVFIRSYVNVYRSRLDDECGSITAGRDDVWRRRDSAPGWELVSRRLTPDDVVLAIGNLSFWF